MDSLHWLLPKFTVPTWLDGLIAIMICLVGWLIQRFIIKKIIHRVVIFLKDRQRNFQANVLAQFSKAIGYAFMTTVIVLSLSYLIKVPLFTRTINKEFCIVYYGVFCF